MTDGHSRQGQGSLQKNSGKKYFSGNWQRKIWEILGYANFRNFVIFGGKYHVKFCILLIVHMHIFGQKCLALQTWLSSYAYSDGVRTWRIPSFFQIRNPTKLKTCLRYISVRVAPDFGSDKSEIRPFFPNPAPAKFLAKFGRRQCSCIAFT